MLTLSVTYVALQSTVYSLLDKMVIDSTKQQSSSRPRWVQLKTGSPIIQKKKKTFQIVRVIFAQGPCHSKKKNARSLCTALTERQGHASPLCHLAPRPCHFSICVATDGQNATSSLVSSLQMTPIHSHSSRTSSSPSSRKKVYT